MGLLCTLNRPLYVGKSQEDHHPTCYRFVIKRHHWQETKISGHLRTFWSLPSASKNCLVSSPPHSVTVQSSHSDPLWTTLSYHNSLICDRIANQYDRSQTWNVHELERYFWRSEQGYLDRGSMRYVEPERGTLYPPERGTTWIDFFGSLLRNEIRLTGTSNDFRIDLVPVAYIYIYIYIGLCVT